MPEGRFKSRSFKRKKKKLPGGNNKIHYRKKKPGKAKCRDCGNVLKGVPRKRPTKMKNMARSKKRPKRPFGGVLCSKCTRKLIKKETRN
ncbi:50S ribosomal protein L34e [Candidatus Woesearchaeota archaeon]|nr:50S ribosomal protein L34e [Candidatus Woesearchaeota archaeon]